MEKVQVSLGGRVVGYVRCDTLANEFHPDASVPPEVVSDIVVKYIRDNVLFGRSGDGYSWAETPQTAPSRGRFARHNRVRPAPGRTARCVRNTLAR
jgi:hypothetical protein